MEKITWETATYIFFSFAAIHLVVFGYVVYMVRDMRRLVKRITREVER